MKATSKKVLVIVLVLFGALTLFLSGSVLLDLFGMRVKEGNYVSIVVWANFMASILYLVAAYGIFKNKSWMVKPLVLALVVMVIGVIGFFIHVINNGLYETRTVGALAFRVAITAVFLVATFQAKPKENNLKA
ncbi:MAG: hypothetical protein R3279_01635 [Putridiphycobacter sp.]|nr:hypothetical protein [Putridiphycobacter sp.]